MLRTSKTNKVRRTVSRTVTDRDHAVYETKDQAVTKRTCGADRHAPAHAAPDPRPERQPARASAELADRGAGAAPCGGPPRVAPRSWRAPSRPAGDRSSGRRLRCTT